MKRNMRIVLILGVLVLLGLAVGIAAAQDPEPLRGGRYIVYGVLGASGGVVDSSKLYRLRDLVRAEGAAKGILMTPFRIVDEKIASLEEVSMELVPGSELRKLVEKYLPDRTEEINRFRGFGR